MSCSTPSTKPISPAGRGPFTLVRCIGLFVNGPQLWFRSYHNSEPLFFSNSSINTMTNLGIQSHSSASCAPDPSPPECPVVFFEWSHAQHFPFRTHTPSYTMIVLHGPLRKAACSLALEVWERHRKHGTRKLCLDLVVLGVGVEVLTRSGHLDCTLALIDTPSQTSSAQQGRHRSHYSSSHSSWYVLAITNPGAALSQWECSHREHMGILRCCDTRARHPLRHPLSPLARRVSHTP